MSEVDKARLYRSAQVYCAPNLGGESFGIVLLEGMAAGAAVVASDLEAFRRVLDDGSAGVLVEPGDAAGLAAALDALLGDAAARARLVDRGRQVVAAYDWRHVATEVISVYETVIEGADLVSLDATAVPAELGGSSV